MTVRKNPPENKEQLQKFPLNLKFLYATGPSKRNGAIYISSDHSVKQTMTQIIVIIKILEL